LTTALIDVKDKIRLPSACNNLTEQDPCEYSSDPSSDPYIVYVVETPYNAPSVLEFADEVTMLKARASGI
jgi:recombination protein RecR